MGYVVSKVNWTFCPKSDIIREIKFSLGTKCKREAKLQTKYALKFILNQINSGEFNMAYVESFKEKEKDLIFRFKAKFPQYLNKPIDIGFIASHLKKPNIDVGKEVSNQIEFIQRYGDHDMLMAAKDRHELDDLYDATKAIVNEVKQRRVNDKILKIKKLKYANSSVDHSKQLISIDDLIKRYIKEREIANIWTPKTKLEYLSIFRKFFEITKVEFVEDLSKDVMRGFKDSLVNSGLNPKTINKYITRTEALFEWADSEGYLDSNPVKGIKRIPVSGSDNERVALSEDTLSKIFGSDYYCNPKQSRIFDYGYQYWIPLVGLYTGARINEISQLYVSDIIFKNSRLYFDINASTPDKRLKTKSSKRQIPVHDTLLKLGFLSFIDDLKKRNSIRLFPELKNDRDGYGHRASRWYGSYRKKIGVNEYHVDFHAFRHTFITQCYNSGFETDDIQGLVGHAKGTITGEVYGRNSDLSSRHEKVIDKISFGIEIDKIIPFEKYVFRNGRCKTVPK